MHTGRLFMVTPTQSPDAQVAIPEALRQQLEGFRRELWRVKILEATAAGLMGLLVSYLLVYGLDRFFQTPGWLRLGILLAGVSLFAGFAPYWLHRWVWQQRRDTQLARLIARRYPGLGDRLLGVIELQNQQGSADSLSPRLREAAMLAVANEVAKRQLKEALPPQRHRAWAGLALGLAGVALGAILLAPRAGLNALERWLLPLSKIERYTFTRLENPPIEKIVAFGEAFEITLKLASISEQRPPQAVGRYGLQAPVVAALQNDRYHFNFPGQQDPATLVFRVGDLVHEVRVQPMPRPGIESLVAVVTAPEYLKRSEKTVDLKSGNLSVVEGSEIRLDISSDRPLAAASYGPTRLQVIEAPKPGESPYLPVSGALSISGQIAKTPLLKIGNQPFEIPLSWADPYGLTGDSGLKIRVNAMPDAPPACYLQGIDRQKVMLPEETLDFELLAEDDFGIKRTGIEWSGQFTRPSSGLPAKGDLQFAGSGPDESRTIQPVAFSPAAFNITPQKITLRGFSEDYFPNRSRVYSEPITLYVLSRDEHAQMLKTKFDRVITEFEDLARRELELLDENQRLDRLDGTELQNEPNTKRLETQEQAEAETQRRLEELTERMENLMKDAARNGEIDKATLQKMAESLKPMQELTQQDIPDVKGKLNEAQAPSNTPDKAESDVAKAVDEQKKAVQKMQDAIAKANEANRQFEAGTFVNRLKKAASDQSAIASSLINAYPKILGIRTSKLDPSEQRRLQESASQQSNTGSDIRWLQEDLASYFARTKADNFKQLLDAMKASEIDGGLDEIRKMLGENHSYLATEAAQKWAKQLTDWANQLEGDKAAANGGGGGSGNQNPQDEDFEFMLRVMKLIQKEQDIRSQTRVLEQLRRDGNPSIRP
jgi:hypothetical protein